MNPGCRRLFWRFFWLRYFSLRPSAHTEDSRGKKTSGTQGICYPMKTPTRKHVTNAECTTTVLGLFTRSVPTRGSPKNVCVRTLPWVFILLGLHPSVFLGSLENRQTWRLLFVWEAMVTRDFMRSLRSRCLKVIWAQQRTVRARETRPDLSCTILPATQTFW